MLELPTNNPLYPFRTGFVGGLGSIPGHSHGKTSKILKETQAAEACLFQRQEYSSEEVDRAVRFVMSANKLTSNRPLLMRTQSISSVDQFGFDGDDGQVEAVPPDLTRAKTSARS